MSVTPAAGPAGPPRTGAPDTGDAPPPASSPRARS